MAHRVVFVPAPLHPAPPPVPPPSPPAVPPGFRGKLPEPPPSPNLVDPPEPASGRVDGAALARDVQRNVEQLEADGFEIVSIAPVTSGAHGAMHGVLHDYQGQPTAGYGTGFGYGFTEGLLIVARS